MQVRAANATVGHVDAQLMIAQSKEFGGFDSQVFGSVADNRSHGVALSIGK
jgi:hypothetical protein